MQWYYVANGQRQGPLAQAEFERLVASGTIKSETLVWREGMREWQSYAAVAPATTGADPAMPGEETQVCAVSGKRYPVREMIQYDGKWISAEHRDEYFRSRGPSGAQPDPQGMPGPYGYGGFWRRLAARLIDGIILGVVNQIFCVIVFAVFGLSYGFPPQRIQPGNILSFLMVLAILQVFSICVGITYEAVFIRKFDATPGKMALGVKLLCADGTKLSVGRIVGRYFAYLLSVFTFFIGFIIAGPDDQKRALHDRICETRVVKTRA